MNEMSVWSDKTKTTESEKERRREDVQRKVLKLGN
jgi:hypothetical protein